MPRSDSHEARNVASFLSAGRALLVASTLAFLVACGGGGGGGNGDTTDDGGTDDGGGTAPSALSYAVPSGLYRAGEAIDPNTATVTGTVDAYTVVPALPSGLALNATGGAITGTPIGVATTQHTVTATNEFGSTNAVIDINVGIALPAAVDSLRNGFLCEAVTEGRSVVTKIALAPDGRIFFTEVGGNVGVISTGGTVTSFATETVSGGGHHGLIGLALDPDFANNGFVYLQMTIAGMIPTTNLVRWTDSSSTGTNRMVVIANLPASPDADINNGGELHFDMNNDLLISIGDIANPATAQDDGSLAGKILRFTPTIPPTFPGATPIFSKGLRNTFGLAIHPATGGIFGIDNGPMSDDELNFIQDGKNYEWENAVPPPAEVGFKIRNYPDVIVPTGIEWHNGNGWGAEYNNDLFLCAYDEHTVRRFEMSGSAFTDIDSETVFAQFVDNAGQNNPLDLEIHTTTGDIYVSTFSGIYRFTKQ